MNVRNFYDKTGLRYFPLVPGRKDPAAPHGFHATEEEIARVMQNKLDYNFAVICGKVSGNLVVLDFESEEDAYAFFGGKDRLLASTLCIHTCHGGLHIYFRTLDACPNRMIGLCAPEHTFDICGEGGYVVGSASVIDHTKCVTSKPGCPHTGSTSYEIISSTNEIQLVTDLYRSILNRCKELGWEIGARGVSYSGAGVNLELGERNIPALFVDEVRDALAPIWINGRRYTIQMALVGWLLRLGVSKENVLLVVTRVAHDLALKVDGERWDPKVQLKEVNAATRSVSHCARLYGLGYLVDLAKSTKEDGSVTALLDINKRIKSLVK